MDWSQFHFLRPAWFLALVPLAALLWLLFRRRSGSRWEAVCDPVLLPFILLGSEARPRRFAWLGLVAGGLLAIAALAGPTWSRLPQPVFSPQSALGIALDLSRSMDANDISPSRLARARFKIADLLRQRQEGQTALLVYAGDAFTVAPLTDDGATILSQLPAVTTDIMPAQGSRADLALERAGELLRQAGRSHGDVLLITDEVDASRAEKAARDLVGKGFRLSVLGVGTEQGAPIALSEGGFLKDSRGEIVVARFDEAPMRRLAQTGGGTFARLSMDDSDLDMLGRQFEASVNAMDAMPTGLRTDVWEEQGPWLLLALLPLAAIAFRRGYVAVLLLGLMPLPRPASALDWDSLWLRADQMGKRALEAGDPGRAARLFRDPDWKGTAHYRAGEFDAAASALDGASQPDSLYNRGNALARLGRYSGAIAAYDEVLRRIPEHADAKYNKALLEQELQRQAPQAQQGEQQEPPGTGRDQPREGQDGQTSEEDSGDQAAGEEQTVSKPPPAPEDSGRPAGRKPVTEGDRDAADEERQAAEQWLRRIPDDPGGLLRRKFLYQYKQGHASNEPGEKSW
ncbi:MAG: VWA domain-containing protein [Gammaproteobacteria bacterium]|nr:VWA domain-containing protein [Gammaproteobacteria bacterium]